MQINDIKKINLLFILGIIISGSVFTSCEGTDDSLSSVNFNYFSEMKDNTLVLTISNIVAVSEQNLSMPLTEVSISIDGELYQIKPYAPSVSFDIPSTLWPKKGDFNVLIQFYSNHGNAKTERSIWYFFSEPPVFGISHIFDGTVECTTSWDKGIGYLPIKSAETSSDYGEDMTFYMVRTDDYTFDNKSQTDESGRLLYDQWTFKMNTGLKIDEKTTNVEKAKITIESIIWDDNDLNKGEEYTITIPRTEGDTDWVAAFGKKHTVKITYTCTGVMENKEVKYSSTTDQCVIFATPSNND